ncbi:MAG: gliding motility-associated protein GldE [Bacteroidales bacterium]|nr:gliding motility-associated protein GldE [Candidatus Physcousia equi]
MEFLTPSLAAYITLALSVVLLFCSGFVSASEIAFFSLSPSDLSDVEEHKHPSDPKILRLRSRSEHLLATILISNNFVNVAIIMLLDFFFASWIRFGTDSMSQILQFVITTVVLTFLLLLFGEIVPKIYSKQHSLAFCRMAAPVFAVLDKICHPLALLLVGSKKITTRIMSHESQSLTVDDLEQALELTDKKDIAEETSMLQGIIRFGGEMAKEVMTPRVDMVGLEVHATFSEVLQCIVENNYSRIPVYQDHEDNIKGVLYIKDLMPHLNKTTFRWQSLIRPPYFVPETKMIDDLLREFQTNKVHIAIVVDEFGGTSGLVTMEDIIEEIVGEINDETDEDEKSYTRLNQNTYLFAAKTLLSDFYKITQQPDDVFDGVEGDADTLAGLILELKGDFPKLHERIKHDKFTFEIMELDQRRILKVKVVVGSAAT